MLSVHFPANNIEERSYILRFFFKNLGLDIELKTDSELKNYLIKKDGVDKLIIEDHFFNQYPKERTYITEAALPIDTPNVNLLEEELILLFGRAELIMKNELATCGVDLFASAYFMLTRWEESLGNKRDKHHRFPEERQLSVRKGFYHRPIVNEYLVFFSKLLEQQGITNSIKRSFKFTWTSDLEYCYKYRSNLDVLKSVGAALLKRFDPIEAYYNLTEGLKAVRNSQEDPYRKGLYFLINSLVNQDQRLKLYVIPSEANEFDARYSVKDLGEYLSGLDAELGIHPSYISFEKRNQLRLEKERLKEIGIDAKEGRQHFFRFSMPSTWSDWEAVGLELDSSIGFTERAGFRAGICFQYQVFDFENSRVLNLMERPTIIMDVALWKEAQNTTSFIEQWEKIESTVRRFEGELCVLWHPNNVKHGLFRKLFGFLKEKLKTAE